MSPSFYELLQAVSRLRFASSPSRAHNPSPPDPCDSLTPIAARFTRDQHPPVDPLRTSGHRGSLATLLTLGEGTEVGAEDAALLREIGDLLRIRWQQGMGRVSDRDGGHESHEATKTVGDERQVFGALKLSFLVRSAR